MKRFLTLILLLAAASTLPAQLYQPSEHRFYRVNYKAKRFPTPEAGAVDM